MAKKDEAALAAVYQYYLHQNRPYSAQDVFMNLHKEHGKPLVQRVIDQLVAQSKLKEKLNGKQKCYVVNQDSMPTSSEEELSKLDEECKNISDQLAKKQESLKAMEANVRKLNSSLTSKEAAEKLAKLETENAEMKERLDKLQNQQVLITEDEKKSINRKYDESITHWKKRKRMCVDALDSILESWPKSKKDLYEEIGLETDEDVGATFPKK